MYIYVTNQKKPPYNLRNRTQKGHAPQKERFMKVLAMCSILILGLNLSACSHFGKKGCSGDKGSCSMEHKEKCKDSQACGEGECPMKK
jgi:hypothetical protein